MEERFEKFTSLISKLNRLIRKIKSTEMEEYNLKSPHVSCLYYLHTKSGEMTAAKLCEVCEEDKASISRTLEQLEDFGYIFCMAKNKKKYRSPIVLTEKGEQVGKEIEQKINKIVNIAGIGVNSEDRIKMYKNLNTITKNLQQLYASYGEI